jgi:Animal haem peroxidase
MENKHVPPARPASMHHGVIERGLNSTVSSRLFEGRFGRIFRTLPAAVFADKDLALLADHMVADVETDPDTGALEVTPETGNEDGLNDDEENFLLPAGYTYFGQFIDHDITFDPMSSLMKQNDIDGLVDFRTPALDLDNLYGRGPDDQPYMYDDTGRKFNLNKRELTGGVPERALTNDLPRFGERALIGDKRNDENVIVSQLQGLFLRFHNHVADKYPDFPFAEIQRIVRWHYQWLVLFDFLPRIIGKKRVLEILPHLTLNENSNSGIYDKKPDLRFFKWHEFPFMPVEFSGAAYRFGHSMIRPIYRLSQKDLPNQTIIKGLDGRKAIFSPVKDDGLNGFRIFPSDWAIEWDLFFDTRSKKLSPDVKNKTRVQPAYKMDTSLVSPLKFLPEFSKKNSPNPLPGQINSLALRNLKRGVTLGLPSGQDVARFMGLTPLKDEELIVDKATVDGIKEGKPITHADIGGSAFTGKAPLWFYVLAEARNEWVKLANNEKGDVAKNLAGTVLGPVGGRIVGEVLIGLILGDKNSFLSLDPTWKPEFGNINASSVFEKFIVGDIVDLLKK